MIWWGYDGQRTYDDPDWVPISQGLKPPTRSSAAQKMACVVLIYQSLFLCILGWKLILGFLRWFQPPICSSASFCSLKEKHTHTSHLASFARCTWRRPYFWIWYPQLSWLECYCYIMIGYIVNIYGLLWVVWVIIWLVVPCCMNESDG